MKISTIIFGIMLLAGIFKMAEVAKEEPSYYTDLVSFYNGKGELIYQNTVFNQQGELLAINPLETKEKLSIENNGNQVIFTLSNFTPKDTPVLRIYQIDGREIYTYTIHNGSVTIPNLQKGIYLYRLENGKGKPETGKFYIEK